MSVSCSALVNAATLASSWLQDNAHTHSPGSVRLNGILPYADGPVDANLLSNACNVVLSRASVRRLVSSWTFWYAPTVLKATSAHTGYVAAVMKAQQAPGAYAATALRNAQPRPVDAVHFAASG